MIITKTPFRMSFFGGGTDMENFFKENGGSVLSTTFDKYCYVNVRHLPRFFDYSTELSYSKTERVTHFRRVFTSYMHMSPLEYINKVRIQTACEILKKTDESIADIAYKCGFTTNSTFNRNFRQLMGMSPAEWRKRPENYEQQLLKFDIHSEEGW